MTDEKFDQLMALLAEFCETDLDQFAHWKLNTSDGDVFVEVTRKPPLGMP